ncbi:MAG: hypothetical protein HY052_09985 [Proteobacteria bacterium]|nr:hypothetical protein [Pseudomonadota bacterium]
MLFKTVNKTDLKQIGIRRKPPNRLRVSRIFEPALFDTRADFVIEHPVPRRRQGEADASLSRAARVPEGTPLAIPFA